MEQSDIIEYLYEKFPKVKQASDSEYNVPCPFCKEDSSKRGRLYINVATDPPALFQCKLCGETGALNKLRKFFGDPIIPSEDFVIKKREVVETSPIQSKLLRAAAEFYYENLSNSEETFQYLRYERGLEFETIEEHLIGHANGGLNAHLLSLGFEIGDIVRSGLVNDKGKDFFYNHVTLPYFLAGDVVQIRGHAIGGKYLTPSGQKAFPFNIDDAYDPERLIICEGEFDTLTMKQLGFNAIGVPGANTWQDRWTAEVEKAKRIFICFDNDDPGRTGAEKLATKLGAKARVVHLPDKADKDGVKIDGLDVSDLVLDFGYTKEDFEMLFIRSKSSILVTVDEAYEEWLNLEGNPNLCGLKLGYSLIDQVIAPGILPSQVLVVLAKTGVGKTLSLLNIFQRMAMSQPDKKVLFVSLEQTRNEWFERARRMHRFYDPDATEHDTLNLFRDKLMMVDKNRVTEDELISCIEQFEYDMGQKPDLVAIDYLGYWAKSYERGNGGKYDSTSDAIMAMKAIAKEYKVPFIAPHQVSRMAEAGEEPGLNSARDSGAVEETADYLFALWAPDQRTGRAKEERSGEVNLKILKSRHGGVGTKLQLQFAPLSLTMVPKGDRLDKGSFDRAVEEYGWYMNGDTFDQVVERRRTGRKDIWEDGTEENY